MKAQKLQTLMLPVAVAGLLAAATACSFDGGSSRASNADMPAQPLTAAGLLSALHDRGMSFEYLTDAYSDPFDEMNGFVSLDGGTGEFALGEETLSIYQFTGPGEALVAATRIEQFGDGFMMPGREGEWIGGSGGYAFTGPRYYFQEGLTIARYIGDSTEIPDALDEVMGEPFAGTPLWDDDAGDGEHRRRFESIWRERVPATEFVSAESFGGRSQGVSYRIEYRANLVHSFACSGETDHDNRVEGDEVHITIVQRLIDTDVVDMTEPCDLEWDREAVHAIVHRLEPGKRYSVFINGEESGSFVAE